MVAGDHRPRRGVRRLDLEQLRGVHGRRGGLVVDADRRPARAHVAREHA